MFNPTIYSGISLFEVKNHWTLGDLYGYILCMQWKSWFEKTMVDKARREAEAEK